MTVPVSLRAANPTARRLERHRLPLIFVIVGVTEVGIGLIESGYLVGEFGVRGGQLSALSSGIGAVLFITPGTCSSTWRVIEAVLGR